MEDLKWSSHNPALNLTAYLWDKLELWLCPRPPHPSVLNISNIHVNKEANPYSFVIKSTRKPSQKSGENIWNGQVSTNFWECSACVIHAFMIQKTYCIGKATNNIELQKPLHICHQSQSRQLNVCIWSEITVFYRRAQSYTRLNRAKDTTRVQNEGNQAKTVKSAGKTLIDTPLHKQIFWILNNWTHLFLMMWSDKLGRTEVSSACVQWIKPYIEAEEEEFVCEVADEEDHNHYWLNLGDYTISLAMGWRWGRQSIESNPIWAGSLWPASPGHSEKRTCHYFLLYNIWHGVCSLQYNFYRLYTFKSAFFFPL